MDGSVTNQSATPLEEFERYSAKRLVLPDLIIVVVVFLSFVGLSKSSTQTCRALIVRH